MAAGVVQKSYTILFQLSSLRKKDILKMKKLALLTLTLIDNRFINFQDYQCISGNLTTYISLIYQIIFYSSL